MPRGVTRRSVLAVVAGTAVAGCTGRRGSRDDGEGDGRGEGTQGSTGPGGNGSGDGRRDGSPTTVATPTPTGTPPPDATRRVSVDSVSLSPDPESVDLRIAPERPYATDDHPPTVRATVENQGNAPVEVRTGVVGVFRELLSEGDAPRLYLGETPVDGTAGDCWRATRTPARVATHVPTRVPPGGRTTATHAVLDYSGGDRCLPPGRYRFVADDPDVCRPDGDCLVTGVEFVLRLSSV